ncbi:MAG: hypothetical protein ND807_13410 [Vicinamibacterales bacterium]|nr:hypothetical protein [Vicinamibacterales bacterium]
MTPEHTPPSSLRLPATVLLLFVVPPLALVAWMGLSGSYRGEYWRSIWVRAGLGLVVGSAIPLLIVGVAAALGLLSDPNPNPIGLGLLFFAGGIVGTVLVAVGVISVARRAGD